MTQFVKNSRMRKFVSTLCAFAMLSSLIVVPAFAATPATGTLTSAGTTGVATVSGSASNGLNGVHTVEVTGTASTQATLWGARSGADRNLTFADFPPTVFTPSDLTNFKVTYGAVDTTITGLTMSSTLGSVLTAIASQVPSVTAGYNAAGFAFIKAKQYGDVNIAVTSNTVADLVFGATTLTAGTGYSGFKATDSFTPVGGKAVTLADATLGYVDSTGAFKAGADPASGLFTAAKLASGYDLVLATSKTLGFDAVGLSAGKAVVTVGAGVRDVAAPKSFSVNPKSVQAGKPETMTLTLEGPASGDATAAIDAACFTLPAGWSVPSSATVTAKVGSNEASAVISGNVINTNNFVLGVGQSLEVTVAAVTPYTKAGKYNFAASFKNVGTTTFTPVEIPALPTVSGATVTVVPFDAVASISLSASGNRAGGISVVSARLYDKYQNEFDGTVWDREVKFSNITSPVVDPASVVPATPVGTWDSNYGYSTEVGLSAKEGITTIQAVVAGEATATVNVNTTGVGEPAKLVLTSEKNPALSGESVRFHLGLVDAAGKPTSYLTGDRDFEYFWGPGGAGETDPADMVNYGVQAPKVETIPAQRSEIVFTRSDSDTTWDMWAVDFKSGALTQSDQLTQVWGPAPVVPGTYTKLKVTATPVVPVHDIDGWMGTIENDGSYGYAAVGGQVALKVQAVDGNDMPVVPAKTVTISAADNNSDVPGTISSTTATLGVDGSYTFIVKSTFPTWAEGMPPVFNSWTFADAAAGFSADGHTLFYAPEVKTVEPASRLVLANGTDSTAITASVVDLFGAPVAGQKVMFSTDLGTLSAASAVTGADGKATVTIKGSVAGSANVRAVVGSGQYASTTVRFTEYQAVLVSTPSVQQSGEDYDNFHLKFKIVGLDGQALSFTKDNAYADYYDFSGDIDDINEFTVDNGVVDMDFVLCNYELVAGDQAVIDLDGYVTVRGPLGTTTFPYTGIFKLPIVNNAVVSGKGSTLLGQAGISGYGFRQGKSDSTEVYAVKDGMKVQLFSQWNSPYIDGAGKLLGSEVMGLPAMFTAGSYDLIVDGITFPGALVVSNDLAIGSHRVLNFLTADSGANYVTAGSKVVLSGAVVEAEDSSIADWSPVMVKIWSSASADGSNPTLVGGPMLTDANGRFSLTVAPSSTRYYFATSDANTYYGAGSSLLTGITKVSVKTKTTMKVTSAPKSVTHGKAFTAKGSISGSHGKATTVAFKIYRSSGSLYKTYTVSLAAGQKTFSKTGMTIGSKGTFYVKAYHSDYNHLASTSAGWKVVVK